jgi:hypothetical protein
MVKLNEQAPDAGSAQFDPRTGTRRTDPSSAIDSFGRSLGNAFSALTSGNRTAQTRSPTAQDLFDPVTDRALTEDGIPEDPEFTSIVQKEAQKLMAHAKAKGSGQMDRARAIAVARRLKELNPTRARQIESTFNLNQGKTLQELEREFFDTAEDTAIQRTKDIREQYQTLGLGHGHDLSDDQMMAAITERSGEVAENQRALERLTRLKQGDETSAILHRRESRKALKTEIPMARIKFEVATQNFDPLTATAEQRANLEQQIQSELVALETQYSEGYVNREQFEADFAPLRYLADHYLAMANGEGTREAVKNAEIIANVAAESDFYKNNPGSRERMVLLGKLGEVITEGLATVMRDREKKNLVEEGLLGLTQLVGNIQSSLGGDIANLPSQTKEQTVKNLEVASKGVRNYLIDRAKSAGGVKTILTMEHEEATVDWLKAISHAVDVENSGKAATQFMHASLQLMASPELKTIIDDGFHEAIPGIRDTFLNAYNDYKIAFEEKASEDLEDALNGIAARADSPSGLTAFVKEMVLASNVPEDGRIEDSPLVQVQDGKLVASPELTLKIQSQPPEIQQELRQRFIDLQSKYNTTLAL